jgi:hypothetical protein
MSIRHKQSFDRDQQQIDTVPITLEDTMGSREFARGVDDARRGVPFDSWIGGDGAECWDYERGRQFAHIAPITMPLRINGKLNRTAIALLRYAVHRKLIV